MYNNVLSVISICLPRYFCELQSFINPSLRNSMDKNKTLTEMLGCKTLYLPLFGAYSPSLCTKWQSDCAFMNHEYCTVPIGQQRLGFNLRLHLTIGLFVSLDAGVVIWYQNRHMECVQRHVTQEMPYFKTSPSHLQFCWNCKVSVEVQICM